MTRKTAVAAILDTCRDNRGQGLVEYALILVLIAVVVIVAVKGIGSQANSTFTTISSAMSP
ncbi:MAG TPA: Flp family type IVb pilin [Geomonas sp.]|nr:Flp family type IVb pilin [Geomonas sp.]